MRVFEFHFNPPSTDSGRAKQTPDLIFDSFCFEPENLYEKRLGSLYMVGILKNALPQNVRFLDNLAKVIKEKYYQFASSSPEKSLKSGLRKTNEYLEKIARTGDVSWLGNISFGVISLKNYELNFTKVGDLKLFLLRKGQIIDIDKNLNFGDIEPYPLKIFGNIVSGKLAENDTILVLTKEVVEVFLKENLMAEITEGDPKKLKQVLNGKKEALAKTSGVCLLISLTKEVFSPTKEAFGQTKHLKIFSLKKVFSPLLKIFKMPKVSFKIKEGAFKLKKPKIPQFKLPQIKLPYLKIKIPKIKIPSFYLEKRITLVLLLILFLISGFFIFQKLEEKQLKTYQAELNQIKEKVSQADSYLLISQTNPQAEKKANALLRESLEEISPLANLALTFPSDFANQVLTLKNDISENLLKLSKLKVIEDIQPIFQFNAREFIPQRIISDSKNLYFFSPYSENIFEVNEKGEGKVLSIAKKINSAILLSDSIARATATGGDEAIASSILFFSKPDQLINFQEGNFQTLAPLQTPYSDFNFNVLASFQSNLYFLDNQNGKIIRYPYLGNLQWGAPQSWLSSAIKNAADFKSIAVDGSLWVLGEENVIGRYYAGNLRNSLKIDIFPVPKELSKIFTTLQLPYLYFLEPAQKRIVILNKSGQIIAQYQSEKFDNLLDFSVSVNGKTIYLLNGLKVYKVEF